VKRHAIFDGVSAGGIVDGDAYPAALRPGGFFTGVKPGAAPAAGGAVLEVLAGAINTDADFASGVSMALCGLGETGRFLIHTLNIEEQLGRYPAAERLLRNMIRYASAYVAGRG
jgi:hypothetical protein